MIAVKTVYTPEEVGYDSSRLDVLNRHFQRMLDADEIHSANYCLSRDGKIFADTAMGRLSYSKEDTRELRPDTIQWIASITKLFTATAIFKLAEDGILRLNQPAGEILPEMSVPPFNTITIAHLLSHTSGLNPDPGCFDNKYFKSPWSYIEGMRDIPWLEAGLSVGMHTKSGTEWAYSSFGYVILGEIISRASGVNVHEYIAKQIIEPCALSDTFFPDDHPKTDAARERMIAFARRMNFRNARDEKEILAAIEGKEQPPSCFDEIPGSSGAIQSTAKDMNRFGTMLLNQGTIDGQRILGRRAYLRMTEMYTTPDIRDWCWGAGGISRQYALGPDRRRNADSLYGQNTFFHEGAGGCSLIIDPEERLVAAWFVPFTNGVWRAQGLYNAAAIMWSGLR